MNLPTLFISHGAPTFALEPGRIGHALGALGMRLPRPRAVVIVSPHWITAGLEVNNHPHPPTIHDFGGFPDALYALRYPAPGAPDIAKEVLACLAQAGVPAHARADRGLDHGAWIPLMHLYPDADVPVLQLSLPATGSIPVLLNLGRALAPLRSAEILIVTSGCITHNLRDMRPSEQGEAVYARAFMEWVADAIARGDLTALADYRRQAPDARRAHPTDEHLLPLFIAIGAAGDEWTQAIRLQGDIDYGVIGMDSYAFAITQDWRPMMQAIAA